jgi:nucleotide-binding universal stress UspA family protein
MSTYQAHAMGELTSILLATDGSAFCEGAIREAIALSKACRIRLAALTVMEMNPELEAEGPALVEKMEVAAREHLDGIQRMAAEKNVECEVVFKRHDTPEAAIVEEAKKRASDVIVMGRRGKTGLLKALMGSVTKKVIGSAPCKVLVVPRTG